MNTQETIDKLRTNQALLQEFSIRSLAVFGSVVRGEAGPQSDVDILVEFQSDTRIGLFGFARLQRRLSELLGRSVDLVTPEGLHPALKDRILQEAVHVA